jgi:NAD(P)-dependent dehydrogenase (short-subunit alcohol dehydrogenase family)
MNTQPRKRVCLLTGASGRLGSAFCGAYSQKYRIAAVYRAHPPQPWTTGSESLPADDVYSIRADLAEADAARRVVRATLTRFGSIDLLVNAAAISCWAPIVGRESVLARVEDMLALNAVAPLRMAAAVADLCWRGSGGGNGAGNRNVVNVSSTAGVYVYPGFGQSGYAASKAALNMLTCHLADEFAAFGVRANALAPNSFPSHVPTERVASAIVRLDESDLTGQILVLDGDHETLL